MGSQRARNDWVTEHPFTGLLTPPGAPQPVSLYHGPLLFLLLTLSFISVIVTHVRNLVVYCPHKPFPAQKVKECYDLIFSLVGFLIIILGKCILGQRISILHGVPWRILQITPLPFLKAPGTINMSQGRNPLPYEDFWPLHWFIGEWNSVYNKLRFHSRSF